MTHTATYSTGELSGAIAFGVVIEIVFFALLAFAQNTATIQSQDEDKPDETPIEVKPVLDELPLLKLGSKKMKAKLPDMWVKKPPIKRYKDVAAPSPDAPKTLDRPTDPDKPLAKLDETPPPPDAAVAKQVDEDIPETDETPKEQNLPEEGAEDGVKEGTETDPLKAFAISQYKMKIAAWFNARFHPPRDEIECEVLRTLRASVVANVGSNRSVTGFSIGKPSGNSAFDGRVQSTMSAIVSGGAQLPPPPPNYPDILETTQFVGFIGRCDS
jgi:hypothetical protein